MVHKEIILPIILNQNIELVFYLVIKALEEIEKKEKQISEVDKKNIVNEKR